MTQKTFKQFLSESELTPDYRKIIKTKKNKKTVAYRHPVNVGGFYYGVAQGSAEAGGEGGGGGE